ncbi:MAG TPA: tetratricopeptide repeat protein [Bryobacteraceae bacterium]|nr:tetratricopeptide repeat protein [Bryobacteraceae bacterium]
MRYLVVGIAALALYGQDKNPPAQPQYFDEPNFIVAGVTDPSQRGGHGSDPVLHSADALAKDTAALRTASPVADAAEREGHALTAVREYQRAAERDPSEANLFNWGAELLYHRAADQAVEVFSRGNRLFPYSVRMLLGLAVALYSRGSYEEAGRRFFQATDLNPKDPAPYRFLGKISSESITGADGFARRMERFARLQPQNAWANYYYASVLWRNKTPDDTVTAPKVLGLLEKAVHLDPKCGEAFLLLGTVFGDQNDLREAIAAYKSAIDANPSMAEAHYRLALAYRKTGDPAKAQKEIDLYQASSQQAAQSFERERAEIQQFVFGLKP